MENESDFLYAILSKYSEKKSLIPVDAFLREEMRQSKLFDDKEIEETIEAITRTLSSNRENREEIKEYRKKGLGIAVFLRDVIDKATVRLSREDRNSVIEHTKNALSQSNVALFNQLNNESIEEIVPPLVSTEFDDLNKTAIAQNLQQEIELNTHLRLILLEGAIVPASAEGVENGK
jgi:DNA polymerase IIIc chi subunit